MVRILGWEIRRLRPLHADTTCEMCGGHDSEYVEQPLRTYHSVQVCSHCEADVEVRRLLDLQYWRAYPRRVPSCINCGKSVPAEQIKIAVCLDWYFCPECASNPEVRKRFERLREESSR